MVVCFGNPQLAEEDTAHAVVVVLSSVDQDFPPRDAPQLTRRGAHLMDCGRAPMIETTFIVRDLLVQSVQRNVVGPRSTRDRWGALTTRDRPARPQDSLRLCTLNSEGTLVCGAGPDNRSRSRFLST